MIPHSDAGNAKLIPFLYAPGNIMNEEVVAYTLLWTTQDVRQGELVTRDYLYGMKENKQRSARLAIWYKLPSSYYVGGVRKYDQRMQELEKASVQIL